MALRKIIDILIFLISHLEFLKLFLVLCVCVGLFVHVSIDAQRTEALDPVELEL